MKRLSFWACLCASALLACTLNACSDDDPVVPETPVQPEEPSEPEEPAQPEEPVIAQTYHFDVWVTVGSNGGMGSTDAILVKSLDSLTAQPTINFLNDGVDVTATIKEETILKGKYYYQVPVSADRFAKYQIVDNKLVTIAEQPFVQNTFKDRRYTHAWIDDNTLVFMAANGTANKVIWTKVDASDMHILAEGELTLEVPEGDKFSTSGLARYRKSDDRIIYFFQHKKEKTNFYAAFINAQDMSVENEVMEDRAEMMAGTAYGELLQDKMFFDDEENLYLACNSVLPGATSSTQQFGRLLRVKRDALDFDKEYVGFRYETGKLITASYLANGKALLYVMDPEYTGANAWANAYNSYYAVLDLTTDERSEIQFEGKGLPFSSGNFSQRSVVVGDKAYIGTNPENEQPTIYIYDIPTGNVTKGLSITEGYGFDRITVMDNADQE
ncbi:MAG: hypothetical protein PUK64_11270 [bacterium]|nr:hypothetical protein [bacterium]